MENRPSKYAAGKIYKLIIHDKTYVGSTIASLKERFEQHMHDARNGYGTRPLHKCILQFIESVRPQILLIEGK